MREFAVLIALGVALCHQISQLVLRQRNINSDKSTSFTSSKQTQISTNTAIKIRIYQKLQRKIPQPESKRE
jgi:hypothetical protein